MNVVKQLYDLQAVEVEVESLERETAEINDELADNDAISRAQNELKRTQEKLKVVRAEQRVSEIELSDMTEKITSAEKNLYSGRTGNPKELVNLQSDIDNQKGKHSEIETRALDLMEQVEALRTAATNAKSELKKIKEEKASREVELKEELTRLEPLLSCARKQRDELISGIATETIRRYYLIKSQKGHAVAKIEQGVCSGCRISLPSREIQRARGKHLVWCSSCGRLLYMP
ncbi:MAG: C4-type zinc ribbon domain-containing protein [Chloroflexota bacterium]